MKRNARNVFAVVTLVFAAATGAAIAAKPPGGGQLPPNFCRFVLCAYPDCLPNEHTVIPPGQCCPVCVPN